MLVNKEKCKIAFTDVLLVMINLAYAIGIRRMFPVCEIMGETIMNCHWAGEVEKALGIVFIVLGAAHLLIPDGRVKSGRIAEAVGPDTALISVMYANNETGRIQPVREIGEIAAARGGVLVYCDSPACDEALQAIAFLAQAGCTNLLYYGGGWAEYVKEKVSIEAEEAR